MCKIYNWTNIIDILDKQKSTASNLWQHK